MDEPNPSPILLERFPSGVVGLDTILNGGLFRGGVYIVSGRPGSGKTLLSNQIAFAHARRGGHVAYVTLLSETHGRLLSHLRSMRYFDPALVGSAVTYVSGYNALEQSGLDGLLEIVRRSVRDARATLLVLDGLVTVERLASSDLQFKKFVQKLQTWSEMNACTVLLLTSAVASPVQAQHTMVDGIFELETAVLGRRTVRRLQVTKFRGSGFLEGWHAYTISDDGITVFPRLEALPLTGATPPRAPGPERLNTGVRGLDKPVGGGFLRGTTTLALGSSGSGKTVLGLQFLAAGLERKEPVLHVGFFENPPATVAKAARFGLDFEKHARSGLLEFLWHPPTERLLDVIGHQLLTTVERRGIKRLFFDGFAGLKTTAFDPERVGGYFSALREQLAARGVTTVVTEETRELFVSEIEVPTYGVSGVSENILFLRQVEVGAELQRLLSVMKVRDSGHDATFHRYTLDERGFTVGKAFTGAEAAFLGFAGSGRASRRGR